jgi:chemotaxis protein MotD
VSGFVPEASALYSRASSTVRNSQSKYYCSPDEGTFAALMDSQAEPAPKPSQKADKPAASDRNASDPVEPATEAVHPDVAGQSNPLAPEARTDGDTEAEAKVNVEQDFCEAIQPVEATAPAADIPTDPATVEAPAVIDPNAVAPAVVAAPVVAAPVVAAAVNAAETPSEATDEPLAGADAAAPALPSADETAAPTKKAEGKRAPQIKAPAAPAQNPANAPDDALPEVNAAEATGAAPQHAKPAVPQGQAAPQAPAPQDAATQAKPQNRSAADLDAAQPSAKPASEPATQAAAPAPVIPHATTAIAAHPQAAPVSAAQPVPINALAVEIAGQARAGNSRFEIRLDPPELGRIDVRLDVDRDGNVTSRLVIERADTYDLLRRDQSTLERALQQAGLKTADNALEFSLRDQGFAQQRDDETSARSAKTMVVESEIAPTEAASGYARLLGARGGIDIRV